MHDPAEVGLRVAQIANAAATPPNVGWARERERPGIGVSWLASALAWVVAFLSGSASVLGGASGLSGEEGPSLVLIQRVTRLVLNTGGDGSSVACRFLEERSD
jgi:hypothetical protein